MSSANTDVPTSDEENESTESPRGSEKDESTQGSKKDDDDDDDVGVDIDQVREAMRRLKETTDYASVTCREDLQVWQLLCSDGNIIPVSEQQQ